MKGLEDLVDLVGGGEVVPPETFTIDGYEFYQDTPVYLDGRTASTMCEIAFLQAVTMPAKPVNDKCLKP